MAINMPAYDSNRVEPLGVPAGTLNYMCYVEAQGEKCNFTFKAIRDITLAAEAIVPDDDEKPRGSRRTRTSGEPKRRIIFGHLGQARTQWIPSR